MTPFLKALKAYWVLVVLVVFLVGVSVFYITGYRLDAGGITRVGVVRIEGVPEQSLVYIDQARMIRVTGGKTELSLTPGTHSVIIDAPNYLPWNEVFPVTQAEEVVLAPIFVPKKTIARVLTDESAREALALIQTGKIPVKATPLALAGGCANVYLSGTHIIAETATSSPCTTPPTYLCVQGTEGCAPTIIFSPSENVRSIIAYPGRDDALIVATGKLVYVVELDPREPQYFAPLFKGTVIGAQRYATSSITISDGVRTIELGL